MVARDKQQDVERAPGQAITPVPPTSPPAHLGRRCLESLRPDSHSPFSQQARLSSASGLRATSYPVSNPFFMLLSFVHSRGVFLTDQGREVRALVRLGFPTG